MTYYIIATHTLTSLFYKIDVSKYVIVAFVTKYDYTIGDHRVVELSPL